MNEGQLFAQRAAANNAGQRPPAVAHQQPARPQSVKPAQTHVGHAATHPHAAPKAKRSLKKFIIPGIIIVVLLAALGGFMWFRSSSAGLVAVDKDRYQAVFLSNGQVYFGKLQSVNKEYLKLTDVYYLQTQNEGSTSENPQTTATNQSNVQLIKLGDEIHGPSDEMLVSKAQVLFYENLKTDGKVAQSIEQFKKK